MPNLSIYPSIMFSGGNSGSEDVARTTCPPALLRATSNMVLICQKLFKNMRGKRVVVDKLLTLPTEAALSLNLRTEMSEIVFIVKFKKTKKILKISNCLIFKKC